MNPTLIEQLQQLAQPDRVPILQRYFQTFPGGYGSGDNFMGVTVPHCRKTAKLWYEQNKASNNFTEQVIGLLKSPWHEVRLCALFIMNIWILKATDSEKKVIRNLYCANVEYVNNWDLVDSSAHYILGPALQQDSSWLKQWMQDPNLWKRRIAVISTLHEIRHHRLDLTFFVCEHLLQDPADLIHKACGWMLREAGKKDEQSLKYFLHKYYQAMPRVMLRYAIEKFPPEVRKAYLSGTIA
jgi:3-methyladenine DNA glycosylase AlkD